MTKISKTWGHMTLSAVIALSPLAACSPDENLPKTQAQPLELVATHAFDTKNPVVDMAFIANPQAAWLGRVFYLDVHGALYSTDIEGREQTRVGADTDTPETPAYQQIISVLNHDNKGVVLALATYGPKINAFGKMDDQGALSSLSFKAPTNMTIAQFCPSSSPVKDVVYALDMKGNGHRITLHKENGHKENGHKENGHKENENGIMATAHLIPTITKAVKCRVSQDELVFSTAKNTYHVDLTASDISPTIQSNIGYGLSAVLSLADQFYLATLAKSDTVPVARGFELRPIGQGADPLSVSVADGLSIGGISNINSVHASDQNYGGGAFRDGFVALTDGGAARIVFLSAGYLSDKIKSSAPASIGKDTP